MRKKKGQDSFYPTFVPALDARTIMGRSRPGGAVRICEEDVVLKPEDISSRFVNLWLAPLLHGETDVLAVANRLQAQGVTLEGTRALAAFTRRHYKRAVTGLIVLSLAESAIWTSDDGKCYVPAVGQMFPPDSDILCTSYSLGPAANPIALDIVRVLVSGDRK